MIWVNERFWGIPSEIKEKWTFPWFFPRLFVSLQQKKEMIMKKFLLSLALVLLAVIALEGCATAEERAKRAAEQAAKRTKFNAIGGENNQTGTITYYFKLK